MKTSKNVLVFGGLLGGLFAVGPVSAQSCADQEYEASRIIVESEYLPIQKFGFFPYQMSGSNPPDKYSSESWSGSGAYSFQDGFTGCINSFWDMAWNGEWSFDPATGADTSSKTLDYHRLQACFNGQEQVFHFSELKIGLGDNGSQAAGQVVSPTSRHHVPSGDDTRNVTQNLTGLVSNGQAQDYGETHKTLGADRLQYWENYPSADAVVNLINTSQMTRVSPLRAPAQRVRFKAQFCVPCLGNGKFRITYYYKKWLVGQPEPAKCETRTEEVEFHDAPYLVPQSGEFQPYHFEMKQGEQCKLVKVTAHSAEDCAKREPGASSGANHSVDMFFYLGKRTDGAGAGALAVSATAVSPDLYSPAALQLQAADHPDVLVIKSGDVLRQVKAPETFVDVVTVNASSYELRFYLPSQVGALNAGTGLYATNGQPFVTYTVADPDNGGGPGNRILFTEARGSQQKETLYTYDTATGMMAMSAGNGARLEELVVNGATETRTIKDADGHVVSVVRNTMADFPFGRNITQRVVDPNGANLITSYAYYTDPASDGGAYGQVRQVIEPTGHWTRYAYDAQGRAATTVTQFLDAAVGSADNLNRVTSITYGTVADEDGDSMPEKLTTTLESLLGQETGRSYEVVFSKLGTSSGVSVETRWSIQCTAAGAAWNASGNLVTKRQLVASGAWFGKPIADLRPDGTLTTYAYSANATQLTTTIDSGAANGIATAVVAGTRTIQVDTLLGQMVSREVFDLPSNTALTSEFVTQNDSLGRPTRIDFADGTYELRSYACCGLDSVTDRQGIATTYLYNALGQVYRETRGGIAQVRTLDPEGRVLSTKRVGTDDSEIVTQTQHFDVAGRLVWSRDALNRQTSYSEAIDSSGHTIKTTTSPDLGTIVSTFYCDGSALSITGTAAPQALAFASGVDGDGVYVRETHLGSSGETTEWVKSYSDFAGRPSKRVFADGATEQSHYNAAGQLDWQADADGVKTLFAYNAKGEQEVVAIDINGNGVIDDVAATDRVTRTTTVVTSHGSHVVRRTTTTVLEDEATATPTTVSVVDATFDGTYAWQTVRGLETSTMTALTGSGGRTVTSIAPDQTMSVQTFADDRVQSVVVSRASIGTLSSTSYAYDSHGRLQSTAQLSSTNTPLSTSYTYFDDDQVHTVTTPDPDTTRSGDGYDSQTTTYGYDAAGRVNLVTQPDLSTMSTTYWPTGRVKRNWGSRTYPVEYSYDAQGRVKTLTTWQDFAGNAGIAVTTWNYTADRGFLLNKRYADNQGPSYTYKPSGRLQTRTWARGTTATYGYNAAGDLSGVTYSDATPAVTFNYDRAGRPNTRTDASGTCAWTYDAFGPAKDEDYSAGTLAGLSVHRSFDAFGRLHGLSSVSSQLSTLNAVTYDYDLASRLETVTAGTNSATYAYFPNSSVVQSATLKHSGTTRLATTKVYDDLNRMASITSQPSAAGSPLSYAYTYNSANQRTRAKREDNSHWDYGYDPLGQVSSAVKQLGSNEPVLGFGAAYTYDDIGNRKTATTGAQSSTYLANLLNQYSTRTVPGTVEVMGSAVTDATVTVGGQPTTRQGENFLYTAIVSNAAGGAWREFTVVGVRPGAGAGGADAVATGLRKAWVAKTPESYGYDADGNLTSDGRWTYGWDGENRLVTMQTRSDVLPPAGHFPLSESRKLEFAYDAQGRRFSKKVFNWTGSAWTLASSTLFLYDGWNLVAELSVNLQTSTLSLSRTHVWGLDLSGSLQGAGGVGGLLLSTLNTQPSTFAAAYDGNGNVTAYVDMATGTKSATYEYSAFGETLVADGVASESLPFRFSTKYTDSESGLLYYGYRYYYCGVGRWLNRDLIQEKGGINVYAFVSNSVISKVDKLGLWSVGGHYDIIRKWLLNRTAKLPEGSTYTHYRWHCVYVDVEHSLMEGNDEVDGTGACATVQGFLGAQRISNSYQHAMSEPGESPEKAESRMRDFIEGNVYAASENARLARSYISLGNPRAVGGASFVKDLITNAIRSIGRAQHPVADQTSPQHAGFQTWSGLVTLDALRHHLHESQVDYETQGDRPAKFVQQHMDAILDEVLRE